MIFIYLCELSESFYIDWNCLSASDVAHGPLPFIFLTQHPFSFEKNSRLHMTKPEIELHA